MKNCSNCGHLNPDDAQYCSNCGKEIKSLETNQNNIKQNSVTKKKSNNKRKIIILVIILILAIVGGYGIYVIYQNQQFNKYVDEGNNYLNENKFQEAITSYQQALTIKEDQTDILLKEVTAALHIRDTELATSIYDQLYNLTQDENYKTLKDLVNYGNSPNNLTNGGIITSAGEYSYIIDNKEGEADIWKLTPEKMELIKTIPFRMGNEPLKSLNIWGNQLYFILGDNICSLDINRKELKTFTMSYVNSISIYKGNIYYTTSITPIGVTPGVWKCSLDGTNPETVYIGSNIYSNWNFIIYNDFLFLNQTTLNASESHLIKISLTDYSSNDILTNSEGIINEICLNNNICYYNTTKLSDAEMSYESSTELNSINLDDNSVNKIDFKTPISTFNIFNNKVYYVSNKKLFNSDLNGQNSNEIGDTLNSLTSTDNTFSQEVFSISTTTSDLFVITSLAYQSYIPVGTSENFARLVLNDDKLKLEEVKFQEGKVED